MTIEKARKVFDNHYTSGLTMDYTSEPHAYACEKIAEAIRAGVS